MCAYSVFNTFPVYPLSAKPLILLAFCRYRYHTSLFNRPDVIQAEYAIKKAAFDVKVAKKMFLPSFNLNEIVGFESFRASRLFNWESIVYQFGAGLLLDLYTGGYKKHFLKYNKELALEKLHKYDYTILDAVRETEDCLSSYKTDYKAYVDFKDMMENSQHYYNVAHKNLFHFFRHPNTNDLFE